MEEILNQTRKIDLIIEKKSNGKFVYTAVRNGETIYKSSPTHRNYIAIMLQYSERDGQYHAANRFGRPDLVGKGDSQLSYRSGRYAYMAVVPELQGLVYLQQPEELKTWASKGITVKAFSKDEAKKKIAKIKYMRTWPYEVQEIQEH